MTDIRECPELLIVFTTSTRLDWTADEVWAAITACRTAGYDWGRIARGLVELALKDEAVPTKPRDLWNAVRGLRSMPGTGGTPDRSGAGGADYLAVKARTFGTGPQPALTADAEEALREGHDP